MNFEELSQDYARKAAGDVVYVSCEGDEYRTDLANAFMAGIKAVLSLPLNERLTISEKKNWCNKHKELTEQYLDAIAEEEHGIEAATCSELMLLEKIFGSKRRVLRRPQYKMSKPIIDPATLNEEQKRQIRCHYYTNKCVIKDHKKRTGDKAQTRAVARIRLFEHLFGSEFFKQNG